jgi:adenosine deaminase
MKNACSKILIFLVLSCPGLLISQSNAQRLDSLLNRLRTNEAALRIFFSAMPKGGDLHHHYSGSIYAEKYIEIAKSNNAWINEVTLEIKFDSSGVLKDKEWKKFQQLEKEKGEYAFQQLLLKHFSAKDYSRADGITSYDDFFETFDRFGPSKNQISNGSGLLWLKQNAIHQKVSYIETMLETIPCGKLPIPFNHLNDSLLLYQASNDTTKLFNLFNTLKNNLLSENNKICIQNYLKELEKAHLRLQIDDSLFTLRYQTYVLRLLPPIQVLSQMIISFEAAKDDTLLVGINMVAPEHHPIALRDYRLHMRMFQFCTKTWPNVSLSLHAGELAEGMVSPENIHFHIQEAIDIAGAKRIGHGTALAFERDVLSLIERMRVKKTVLEINYHSNRFILGSTKKNHPLYLYHKANIPIVICTDDAGVLRTDHNGEFIQIALDFPSLTYTDFKEFVFNSINYSFIKGAAVRTKLLEKLQRDFTHFENDFLNRYQNIFEN